MSNFNGLFYNFEKLSNYSNLKHFISYRNNGVSKGNYRSLNLSLKSNDQNHNVLKNRSILFKSLDISIENTVYTEQLHSGNVVEIVYKDRGRGAYNLSSSIPNADALITNKPNICLVILLADCAPILLFDPVNNVIGVAHAGRLGTSKKISMNIVNAMVSTYNCRPENIIVGIGPCISTFNYKISKNDWLSLKSQLKSNTKSLLFKNNLFYFDLLVANKEQLLETNVLEKNIEIANICTYKQNDFFFSERYCCPTGRFAAGMMISQ